MKSMMFAALISVGASAPAYSESLRASEKVSIAVPYGDLDLGSAAGRQVLDRRMMVAARVICEMPESRDLDRLRAQRRCLKEVRENGGAMAKEAASRFLKGREG